MVNMGLGFFADCIKSLFFGEVCDTCDGKAIYSLLAGLIRLFTIGVGILAVIGIMVTGVMYLTSSGDPAKHNKAKSRFVNIILGLAVYVCLFVMAEFLMPGGIVNHPISSTEETSCPETTYTDTSIRRPENPGTADGTSPVNPDYDYKGQSPYAGKKPSISANKGKYNGTEYRYLEISNATPFAYVPQYRESITDDLKNIASKKEGENILVIANAGTFITSNENHDPTGITIQNGEIINSNNHKDPWRVFVIDEDGNVGYLSEEASASDMVSGKASYVNGLTGSIVTGKKIVSAIHQFGPLVVNGQGVDTNVYKASSHYDMRRQRQIYCMKSDKTNVIISNKEDYDSGGWNFEQMIAVSLERGCQFAFNFDGGGSTATAWRDSVDASFSDSNVYRAGNRVVPSFIVFTSNNLPPGKVESDYQSGDTDETPTKSFDAKTELRSDGLEYWLNVPQGAKDKMPLVIFLHGDSEINAPSSVRGLAPVKAMFARSDFISIAPVLNTSSWSGVDGILKKIIDTIVSEYGINQQRIHIVGFSRGGMGTWYMVNKYPRFFASAVPISGTHEGAYQTNFLGTKVWAIVGGGEKTSLRNDMQKFVIAISSIGGSAKYEELPGKIHKQMQSNVDWQSVFNWMMAQGNTR